MNSVKQEIVAAFEAKASQFAGAALKARLDAEWLDLTLPAPGVRPGSIIGHADSAGDRGPFVTVGFTVLDGPEVEPNITTSRAEHPGRPSSARQQDTFWLTDGGFLRAHFARQMPGWSSVRRSG
jgi:phenylalanyl-tRNA synthetase alpha chain